MRFALKALAASAAVLTATFSAEAATLRTLELDIVLTELSASADYTPASGAQVGLKGTIRATYDEAAVPSSPQQFTQLYDLTALSVDFGSLGVDTLGVSPNLVLGDFPVMPPSVGSDGFVLNGSDGSRPAVNFFQMSLVDFDRTAVPGTALSDLATLAGGFDPSDFERNQTILRLLVGEVGAASSSLGTCTSTTLAGTSCTNTFEVTGMRVLPAPVPSPAGAWLMLGGLGLLGGLRMRKTSA